MVSSKLPKPIDLSINEEQSLRNIIDFVYDHHFKNDFMSKDNREKLNGKFIYLKLDFIAFKAVCFWHIISFAHNEEKYTINPCVNAIDSTICKNLKGLCGEKDEMPNEKPLELRSECIYRLRRINWINPIIKLANNQDSSMKVWHEDTRDKNGNPYRKVFVRFEDDLADYLIVLAEDIMKGSPVYKFITAYPVVHNGTRKQLDQSFEHYCRMNKK